MQFVTTVSNSIRRKYYYAINKILPLKKLRWTLMAGIACFYFYRAYGLQYNVITYLIFFYLIQLAAMYFTPMGLLEIDDEETQQILEIETMLTEEFQYLPNSSDEKPLVSKLNQYQIWERISMAFSIGLICTMFKAIQIDAFWPLLMGYFIGLVCYTFQKIIRKMRKYRYSISDFHKKPILI